MTGKRNINWRLLDDYIGSARQIQPSQMKFRKIRTGLEEKETIFETRKVERQ